jgi:hypothetical protein
MASSPIRVSFDAPIGRALKAEVVRETRQHVAIQLFKRGACSAGVAARMCGLSYREFLELLERGGVVYSRPVKGAAAAERRTLSRIKRGDAAAP